MNPFFRYNPGQKKNIFILFKPPLFHYLFSFYKIRLCNNLVCIFDCHFFPKLKYS